MENIEFKVPSDIALEKRIVAELIGNPDLIPTAMSLITPSAFVYEKCQDAYEKVVKMYEEREQIDIVTMSQKLEKDFFARDVLSQDSYSNDMTIRAHCGALRKALSAGKMMTVPD